MSNVSASLNEQVVYIKEQLIAGVKADEHGRYEVDERRLIASLLDIFDVYMESVKTLRDVEEIWNFDKCIFAFSNLKASLNWQTFTKSLGQRGHGNNFPHRTIKPCLKDVIFENCFFERLEVRGNYSNLIENFVIKKSQILDLVCGYDFLNSNNVKKFTISDSSIRNLNFDNGQNYHSQILFQNCHAIVNIKAEYLILDKIRFENCSFSPRKHIFKDRKGLVTFNSTKFQNTTSFENCKFYVSPKFHGTTFHSDTSFHKTKFLDIKSPEAIGDYRVLKQGMHGLGAEHDAMNFHALEMDARRKTVLPSLKEFKHPEWTASFSSWFLKITNDYGRNYWLPFIWLLGITFVFTCTYYFFNLVGCDSKNVHSGEIWQQEMCTAFHPNDLKISGAYSLQKSLGPISLFIDNGVLDAKTGWAKLVTVFQVMLSSIYWYIIIIQLRRQFRL